MCPSLIKLMLMSCVVAMVLVRNSDQRITLPTICSSDNILKIILSRRFQLEYKVMFNIFMTSEFSKKIVMRVMI